MAIPYPSKIKIKNLGVKLKDTKDAHWAIQKKLEKVVEPYVLDCIKRKDDNSLSKLVDELPKDCFYKLYIFQAIFDIQKKKKKKK